MMQMDIQKTYETVNWVALETILKEIGFPRQFIKWVMSVVTTVTYTFNINGHHTKELTTKRGLRQGDHISPILFVVVMEYLHRKLQRLRRLPDFNFHAKCEKLNIIDMTFADDLLLKRRYQISSDDHGSLCKIL